jgi:hypothetical protein
MFYGVCALKIQVSQCAPRSCAFNELFCRDVRLTLLSLSAPSPSRCSRVCAGIISKSIQGLPAPRHKDLDSDSDVDDSPTHKHQKDDASAKQTVAATAAADGAAATATAGTGATGTSAASSQPAAAAAAVSPGKAVVAVGDGAEIDLPWKDKDNTGRRKSAHGGQGAGAVGGPATPSAHGHGAATGEGGGNELATVSKDWEIDHRKLKLKYAIGKGNFGEVWLATWLGSPVAVKTIVPELQNKEKLVKRFVDEIMLMRCVKCGAYLLLLRLLSLKLLSPSFSHYRLQ